MARKIISVPPLCKIIKDKLGVAFGIERDGPSTPAEIWWDRSLSKRKDGPELLFIRQDGPDGADANVVHLTLAQVYAVIDALNRAVMEI